MKTNPPTRPPCKRQRCGQVGGKNWKT